MTPEERAHMSKLWKELARSYRLSFHNEREMSREFRRQRDEAQRWIPVEEQAVPANRECLMLGEYNNITVGCCDSDGKAFIYEWGGMERVTHWQPLPPLPTE